MKQRVYGVETEYATRLKRPRKGNLEKTAHCAARLIENIPHFYRIPGDLNSWGENGSRFYQDLGAHPEYATPEVTSPRAVVTYQKASNIHVARAAMLANAKLPRSQQFYVMVDNVARVGVKPTDIDVLLGMADSYTSWGQHESISIHLLKSCPSFGELHRILVLFLASRAITWNGTGQVYLRPEGKLGYLISQRAEVMHGAISSSTTCSRGVINTRDEAHAGTDREAATMKRLHLIVSDTNQSESIIWLRAATLGLLLELIELGKLKAPDMAFEGVREALLIGNRDPSLSKLVWRVDGNLITSLEAQRWYFSRAERYFGPRDDLEAYHVLTVWDRFLSSLEGDSLAVSNEVEWIIKRRMLESYARAKFGVENIEELVERSAQAKLLEMDMQYHTLGDTSLFDILQANGAVERMTTDEEIEAAIVTPPQDTRACVRGHVVRFKNRYPKFTVQIHEWQGVSVGAKEYGVRMVKMPLSLYTTQPSKKLERAMEKIHGWMS